MGAGIVAANHSWQVLLKPGAANNFFKSDRSDGFDSRAGGFSPVNAWWLSELSRLIYKRDDTEGVVNPRDIVTLLPPSGRRSRFTHVGTNVTNADLFSAHRFFAQAPSFPADHAPLNYTAQLTVAFEN